MNQAKGKNINLKSIYSFLSGSQMHSCHGLWKKAGFCIFMLSPQGRESFNHIKNQSP